jgi:hypothetical protein
MQSKAWPQVLPLDEETDGVSWDGVGDLIWDSQSLSWTLRNLMAVSS